MIGARGGVALLLLGALGQAGCGDADQGEPGPTGTRAELMDPATCEGCHPKHYREWSSSMHAYAAEDPVFLAMNARGQRETDGALGDFCINCHAPLAVREGLTVDGTNLDEVPDHLEGVTCYFCHNAVDVTDDHNGAVTLANDAVMRGGIEDPVANSMHDAAYSTLHDGGHSRSSQMCGACHDIVTPKKVELERTFQEWRESAFSRAGFQSCGNCHMRGSDGVAADDMDARVPARKVHDHLWPAVDVALTDFPHADAQRAAIECELATFVLLEMAVNPDATLEVLLEANAGHKFPSGASQDRRAWLEVIAYDENDAVLWTTGDIADDEVVDKPEGADGYDGNLWVMRDRLFDDEGNETHMFWEAARYESQQLPTTTMFGVRHNETRTFRLPKVPNRIEAQVKIRPMDFDVLQELVDSGDLDPQVMDAVPTFTLVGTGVHWSLEEDGFNTRVKRREPNPLDCPKDYRCKLDPKGPGCDE